jgi:hypothetical protein
MRGSRAILYAERLSELTSQLSELEDLRNLVEEAERTACGVPPLRLTYPPLRRVRRRERGRFVCSPPSPRATKRECRSYQPPRQRQPSRLDFAGAIPRRMVGFLLKTSPSAG